MLLISILVLLQADLPRSGAPLGLRPGDVSACSDSTNQSRARVGNLLFVARASGLPGRLGDLANVDASALRLLSNPGDRELCQRIRRLTLADRPEDRITGRPWLVAVYEADGFYFAVVSSDWRPPARGPDGRIPVMLGRRGGGWLTVFDSDLNRLTTTRG